MCILNHNSLSFYKRDSKRIFFEYNKEKEPIRDFSLRGDGLLGAFSNSSGYVKIFSLKHKSLLRNFKFSNSPIYSVKIGNLNPHLIAGDDEGNVKVLDFAA